MGQQFDHISEKNRQFIEAQKLFFVGTATDDSRVNISPKGMDSLRVLGPNRVIWLNVTGSGNESAAHVQFNPRMTLMFAAFEGKPNILRLYGKAKVIHPRAAEWPSLYPHFNPIAGARQIFDLQVELVQNSCGMAVPLFDYQGDRDLLKNWAERKGEAGIASYWEEKNQTTIDGLATNILAAD
ncbi:pyridoxamine 5'-phosphate oxidase family protein [Simiduia sp. 21SJ11W-1]|uniref:pyridoxamine 5'-phosphate oxidase family protein n=1 Tax=Simiduia sp. 21SJ11W-1 TaxID=2909669 RepID=UPI0020A18E8C|nr:pyridoxamine 5'-phosphate oxidase family protein [Simiduia sp. 21SJ11W-1]UTA48100.1 pyridoxamine 5'-phosphate oxidase family protein [Simiduia sp. 21SJ11W-1]